MKSDESHTTYAVDLDGTLAEYDGWAGEDKIGEPIPAMVERVKQWLKDGYNVVVFTARADRPEAIPPIRAWLKKHVGQPLPVTNIKRPEFARFYDDRAVSVESNTGRILTQTVKERARAKAIAR